MNIHRSRNGIILGVCQGLEESTGMPAKYFRILFILAAVFFRFWVILGIYLLAALLLPLKNEEEWKFGRNFDNLSGDAKETVAREYKDLMEFLKKTRGSKEKPAEKEEES